MQALVLHPREVRTPRHQVRATARRLIGSEISIQFEIEGASRVDWPVSNTSHGRRLDDLWKQTCLECFIIGPQHVMSQRYDEWNFSSTQDWAAYSFTTYREGRANLEVRPPSIERIAIGDKIRFEIDLSLLPDHSDGLSGGLSGGRTRLGLTAVVIEKGDQVPFYWALAHTGEKPDFHLRESFTFELES